MNIGVAIGKPFSNIANLVIGIILSLIPIVNILTISGYLQRIAKMTMKKDNALPGFGNIGEIIVDSIKVIVLAIIYVIILVILSIIFALIPFIGGALIIILDIVFVFVIISALLTLAKTGSLGAALNIPEVAKKAMNGGFIVAVIVGLVVSLIIAGLVFFVLLLAVGASMLPAIMSMGQDPAAIIAAITGLLSGFLIGIIVLQIVGFILNIFLYTLAAEAYPE